MPLKLVLRPGERAIINGAIIGGGDHWVSFFLYNKANFLRERDILTEEEIDSVEKSLYFAIQRLLISPEDGPSNQARFAEALAKTRAQRIDSVGQLEEIEQFVQEEKFYQALKACRRMFSQSNSE